MSITTAIKSGTYNAYITWNAGTSTYTVQQNFIWSAMGAAVGSFIQLAANEIFEGNDYTIDLQTTEWAGMFAVNVTGITKGDTTNYPIVRNLGILNGVCGSNAGGETNASAGFFMRASSKFYKVENCYSTGFINARAAGGIAGGNQGISNGNIIISNCYSTGQIGNGAISIHCGGIVGASVSRDNADSLIENCYSTGLISGNAAGGIAGDSASNGTANGIGTCRIINCFSTGNIDGSGAGGITGASTAINENSVVEITKCYSLGAINGLNTGGICGGTACRGGTLTITDCYSLGSLIGDSSGGIVGASSSTQANSVATINNCYNVGAIVGTTTGGIAGGNSGSGLTINDCVSNSPIRGSGIATVNNSSTDIITLSTIPAEWSTSIWGVGLAVAVPSVSQNITLPILLVFQNTPFITNSSSPNFYNRADSAGTLVIGPGTVPDAPTNLVPVPGNTRVTISFTEGDNGGNAIVNYKYSLNNGVSYTAFNPAVITSPLTILGLINGITYQIRLRAVNSLGDGAESDDVIVTPATSVTLYAGGEFISAGQVSTNRVAVWNGLSWSALGNGLNSTCRALLLAPDKSVYAGGDFTQAGTISANRISRWNENEWKPVITGVNANINTLANINGTIYLGGEFISSIASYSPMTITGNFYDKGIGKTGLVLYNQFEKVQIIDYENQWIVTAQN